MREHGDALALGRLETLLGGAPNDEAIAALAEGQNEDGGWPATWSGERARSTRPATGSTTPTTSATRWRSRWRALDFLAARRGDDGFWEEDASLREVAPPWAKPGDDAAALYVTSSCAFWLARQRSAGGRPRRRGDRGLDRAGRDAADLPARRVARRGRARARSAGTCTRDLVLQALEPRTPGFDEAALAWLATALAAAGLSVEPVASAARKRLAELQQDNGSWAGDPAHDGDRARALAGRDRRWSMPRRRALAAWSGVSGPLPEQLAGPRPPSRRVRCARARTVTDATGIGNGSTPRPGAASPRLETDVPAAPTTRLRP